MRLFGGFSLGHWLGFEIRIDYSWFLVFFLVLWTFAEGEFPRQIEGLADPAYYVMGTAAALLLFLSVLLHELSHSVVARSRGLEVEGITLFIFGGVARTRMEAKTAADEFLLTAAGPLCSLALGAAFWGLAEGAAAAGLPAPAAAVGRTLAYVNWALAVFNMIPGFPLDGGRIFRSAVWGITGDVERATRWATRGGQAFGWFLVAVGAYLVLEYQAMLNGLWAGFIGWFLATAASSSWDQFEARRILSGVPVTRAMDADPPAVDAEITLEEAARSYFLRRPHKAYPVVRGERVLGLLDVDDVADVPPGRRGEVSVAEAMTPVHELPTTGPDATLDDVLSRLSGDEADRALVVEGERLLGVLTLRQIVDWLERARALGEVGDGAEGPGAGPGAGPVEDAGAGRGGGEPPAAGGETPRGGERAPGRGRSGRRDAP